MTSTKRETRRSRSKTFLFSQWVLAAALAPAWAYEPDLPEIQPRLESLHLIRVPAAPAPKARAGSSALVYSASARSILDNAVFAKALKDLEVVYVTEAHDKIEHHEAQAAVLRALVGSGQDWVLGLEMADARQQPVLDAYIQGHLSEAEFAKLFNKFWGFVRTDPKIPAPDSFPIYRPILEAARSLGVRLVALNAPRGIVRKAGTEGLDALTPEERSYLPAEITDIQDPRYLRHLKDSLERSGHNDPTYVRRMGIWNETMGDNAAQQLSKGRRVMIIVGFEHAILGAGITESVSRRIPAAKQAVIMPYPPHEPRPLEEILRELGNREDERSAWADYFWLLPL